MKNFCVYLYGKSEFWQGVIQLVNETPVLTRFRYREKGDHYELTSDIRINKCSTIYDAAYKFMQSKFGSSKQSKTATQERVNSEDRVNTIMKNNWPSDWDEKRWQKFLNKQGGK